MQLERYHIWCKLNVPQTLEGQLAKCTQYAPALQAAFPDELKVERGVVWSHTNQDNYGETPKQYPHMWCTTAEGDILDPTVEQFCLLGNLVYKAFPEGTTTINKCLYCGAYYSNLESQWSPCCSEVCRSRL